MDKENQRKMDWHLFWTATGVVFTICTVVIGCFISLKDEVNEIKESVSTIKTVLIVKGIMPESMATRDK
jgi:hypothetical protein